MQTISSGEVDFSQLSVAERILLAERLWDSVDANKIEESFPVTPAQRAELESRCAAIDAGEIKTIPWEEARRSLFLNR